MIDTSYRHIAVSAGRDMQEIAPIRAVGRARSCMWRRRPGADPARSR